MIFYVTFWSGTSGVTLVIFVLMISPAINQNRFIKMTMNHEILGTTGRSAIIELGTQLPLV